MLKDVEAREKKLELASREVEKASSGYGPFFPVFCPFFAYYFRKTEGSASMMSCVVIGIIGVVAGYFMQSYFPLSR